MTEIEVAESIIKQDGNCYEPIDIDCDGCPADRIAEENGLDSCDDLWNRDDDKQKQWFQNWLSEGKQNDRD